MIRMNTNTDIYCGGRIRIHLYIGTHSYIGIFIHPNMDENLHEIGYNKMI
jgi:hypothetical protein